MQSEVQHWLERLERLDPARIELGLERVHRVLGALPAARPALTLLVGGTNGKGSCVAYLEAMLSEAGYRVGAYTSPHLVHYRERVRMGGEPIADGPLLRSFEAAEAARAGVPLTYFEFGTLAAVSAFDRAGCDAWILEVGLGGRLDAVNAIEPDASLVVSVALDHQDWLGPDREAIGYEKAGIYRPDRPAVCADPRPPRSLLRHAREIGAQLWRSGHEYRVRRRGEQWSYHSRELRLNGLPLPPLAGSVQLRNAAASIALLEASLGARATEPLVGALGRVRLPGRFQRLRQDGVEWVLDVAHNPAAARALADTLRRTPAEGRTLAVFGILDTKDHRGVIDVLAPRIDEWLLVDAASTGAIGGETLRAELRARGRDASVLPDVAAACEAARSRAAPGDRVVVAGSFYTVGPALAALGLSSGMA